MHCGSCTVVCDADHGIEHIRQLPVNRPHNADLLLPRSIRYTESERTVSETTMKDTPKLRGITLYHAIRALYPNPSRRVTPEGYCVGGALLKFYDTVTGPAFPAQGRLIKLLCRANPGLSEIWAFFYAGSIIRRNDQGDYENAWEQLKMALTHEPQAGAIPAPAKR